MVKGRERRGEEGGQGGREGSKRRRKKKRGNSGKKRRNHTTSEMCLIHHVVMSKLLLYDTKNNFYFISQNLSALVLKIMQGLAAVAPMDKRYSKGLQELIHSLLQRNPDDRPGIENIMAMPIMVNPLMNLCTDIGRLPCSRSGINL